MAENPPVATSIQPSTETAPKEKYSGNRYDLYALVAGTLGGSSLLMCLSFNMALYCLPIVPLALGIIALRKSSQSVDPNRARNLAWVGIAGGGLGTLFTLAIIAFFVLYMVFIFAMIANFSQSIPRR